MTLIENALAKLRGERAIASAEAVVATARPITRPTVHGGPTAVPVPRRKKVAIDGPKHHVSQDDLERSGLLAPLDQTSPIAGEFRRIKRPLIVNAFGAMPPGGGGHMNVIMIASPLPKAGKTFCSVNLAVSMSLERDFNVLLVDADVGKPHITREFGLSDAPGLIDLLLDDGLDVQDVLVRTDMNDIQMLPAGRSHPQATELLASERMSKLVSELATRYSDRIIILDSPPLLITSEAQALASQVGQITLVVETGETTHQQLLQTLDVLDTSKSINVVLNKSRNWRWTRSGDYSGEYGFGYGGQ